MLQREDVPYPDAPPWVVEGLLPLTISVADAHSFDSPYRTLAPQGEY